MSNTTANKQVNQTHFGSLSEMLTATGITPKGFARKTIFSYQTVKRFLKNGRCPKYYLVANNENGVFTIPLSRTIREGINVISAKVRNSEVLNRRTRIENVDGVKVIVFPEPTPQEKFFFDESKGTYGNLSKSLSEKIRQEKIDYFSYVIKKFVTNMKDGLNSMKITGDNLLERNIEELIEISNINS